MRQSKSFPARISRRTFAKGTLAAVVGLSFSTGSAAAAEESADLVTGPDEDPIGSVSISESDGSLTVTYEISDEAYEITETHLHVADAVDEIPTNKPGNPRVGHFEHSSEHEEGAASVVHVVDVAGFGDELVLAAQAKVRTEIEEKVIEEGGEDVEDDETSDEEEVGVEEEVTDDGEEEADEEEEEPEDAWADGERINDSTHPKHGHYLGSWATYTAYQRASDDEE